MYLINQDNVKRSTNNETNTSSNFSNEVMRTQKSREYFDTLVPENKDWFSCREASKILGRSEHFIRNAIQNGDLKAHSMRSGTRKDSRIHRDDLILFLVKTANYDEGNCIRVIKDILCRRFGQHSLKILLAYIQYLLSEEGPPPPPFTSYCDNKLMP